MTSDLQESRKNSFEGFCQSLTQLPFVFTLKYFSLSTKRKLRPGRLRNLHKVTQHWWNLHLDLGGGVACDSSGDRKS